MAVTLLLGGARSGKSARAEVLAKALALPVYYVATAPHIEEDKAWAERIALHQAGRPQSWTLIEEPLDLASLLAKGEYSEHVLLIDCLTLWLSNLMFAEENIEYKVQVFCKVLSEYKGEVILVSNEVGMGLVPEAELGRKFRDEQGRLNQAAADIADVVEFVVAGLPLMMKSQA